MMTHSVAGYARGCRCPTCTTAKAAYMRAKRAKAWQTARRFTDQQGRYLAPGVTHGTAASYRENGCRCQPCTSAASAKRLRERRRAADRLR